MALPLTSAAVAGRFCLISTVLAVAAQTPLPAWRWPPPGWPPPSAHWPGWPAKNGPVPRRRGWRLPRCRNHRPQGRMGPVAAPPAALRPSLHRPWLGMTNAGRLSPPARAASPVQCAPGSCSATPCRAASPAQTIRRQPKDVTTPYNGLCGAPRGLWPPANAAPPRAQRLVHGSQRPGLAPPWRAGHNLPPTASLRPQPSATACAPQPLLRRRGQQRRSYQKR